MKRLVVGGAVLALGLAGMGLSSAAQADQKVTGGGQTLVPADGGAGNTIAFTVQSAADAIKGQVQYVGRDGTEKFHSAEITCLEVNGNTARFSGTTRQGTAFRVDVVDDGQGSTGNDMILVSYPDSPNCDARTQASDPLNALNRGNVTIH